MQSVLLEVVTPRIHDVLVFPGDARWRSLRTYCVHSTRKLLCCRNLAASSRNVLAKRASPLHRAFFPSEIGVSKPPQPRVMRTGVKESGRPRRAAPYYPLEGG